MRASADRADRAGGLPRRPLQLPRGDPRPVRVWPARAGADADRQLHGGHPAHHHGVGRLAHVDLHPQEVGCAHGKGGMGNIVIYMNRRVKIGENLTTTTKTKSSHSHYHPTIPTPISTHIGAMVLCACVCVFFSCRNDYAQVEEQSYVSHQLHPQSHPNMNTRTLPHHPKG